MAGTEPTNTHITNTKTTYTFNEAIEYMKQKDRQPTRIGQSVRWFNVKTGEEVVIGYNS